MRWPTRQSVAVVALCIVYLPCAWARDTRIDTSSGPVNIVIRDNDVQVTVREGGKRVVLEDVVSGKKVEMVDGVLEQKIGNEITLAVRQFELRRGDKVVAEVTPESVARPVAFVPAYAPETAQPNPWGPFYGGLLPSVPSSVGPSANPPRALGLKETLEPPLASSSPEPPLPTFSPRDNDDSGYALPNTVSDGALFVLASSLMASKDFAKSVVAWNEFPRRYPQSPYIHSAGLMLGLAYWNLARETSTRIESATESESSALRPMMRRYLSEARSAYDRVEQTLIAKMVTGQKLSDEDLDDLRRASFYGADCCLWMRDYDEANRRYIALAIRYANRPEEMIALSQQWQCQVFSGKSEKTNEVLALMKQRLSTVRFDSGNANLQTSKRDYWEKWIQSASAQPVSY